MAELNPELVAFSQSNKVFWDRQRVLMDLRMADPAILETAIETIAFEVKRGISVLAKCRLKRRWRMPKRRSGGSFSSWPDQVERPKGGIPCEGIIIDIVPRPKSFFGRAAETNCGYREGDGTVRGGR